MSKFWASAGKSKPADPWGDDADSQASSESAADEFDDLRVGSSQQVSLCV